MSLRRTLLFAHLLFVPPLSFAQEGGCLDRARTPMEQAYCKIRAANPGAALPSLQELRRNPEKTQRLLLRRPAEQAGIALPPESPAAAKRPAVAPATKMPSSSGPATPSAADPLLKPSDSGSLSGCELHDVRIRCGSDNFQLQGNLPNSRLSRDALDTQKPVVFAEFAGDTRDQAAVMEYTSAAYRRYIEAMLDIGLGSATMSFTKFYHTFMDAQAKGTHFGERLGAMFEFLKKDKAAMGVQAHYNDALPQSLEQCMALGDALVVCDNIQQNWVYKKVGS